MVDELASLVRRVAALPRAKRGHKVELPPPVANDLTSPSVSAAMLKPQPLRTIHTLGPAAMQLLPLRGGSILRLWRGPFGLKDEG